MARPISEVGYRAGVAAFLAAVAFDIVQALQLAGVFHFPLDEILIYTTSLGIVVPFVLEMVALHHVTPERQRFWTHSALAFTIIYAVFVTANYVVQLATVVPAKLDGTIASMRLLEQTPHSMFWDLDAVGYIAMALACLCVLPTVGRAGFERWVRMSLIANAAVTPLIAWVYFYPRFSNRLLPLGLPWAFAAPAFMLMLALMMRRRGET
jgi:hypothetical protein